MRSLNFCKVFTVVIIIVLFAVLQFKEFCWLNSESDVSSKICNVFLPSRPPFKKKEVIKPTVTLAVVVCEESRRLEEAVTLLKSAVIFGRDVQFNVITFVDNIIKAAMYEELQILKKSAEKLKVGFTFTIYDVWFPPSKEILWKQMFKPCASQRLFFPSLLPNIEKLIYMDTETLFLSNVKDLWDHFDEIRQSDNRDKVLAAMAAENEITGDGWYNIHAKHPFYGPRGLNSGIMLMNLSKFRELQFEKNLRPIYEKYKDVIPWTDQDILNIYFHSFPQSLHELSCDFNYRITHCDCEYKGDCRCKPAMFNGISILHGNRQTFHKQQLTMNIYDSFREYNLNEGSPQKLLQHIQKEHEEFLKKEVNQLESISPCTKLNLSNYLKHFILYANNSL